MRSYRPKCKSIFPITPFGSIFKPSIQHFFFFKSAIPHCLKSHWAMLWVMSHHRLLDQQNKKMYTGLGIGQFSDTPLLANNIFTYIYYATARYRRRVSERCPPHLPLQKICSNLRKDFTAVPLIQLCDGATPYSNCFSFAFTCTILGG